jgi:predicted MFS family arabinose efflux permease
LAVVARTSGPSALAAFEARDFRYYWAGLVCYVLGYRAEYVTFAWITWEVTHDPLALGYLGLAQGVPLVIFQLFGGVLADRTNRRRLLIGTQALTAVTLTVALALTVLGRARIGSLLVLVALTSTFRAFDEPSRLSLVPQMVAPRQLPSAIALSSVPWQAGRMIGPSITGILIAAFGGASGFLMATVLSYAAIVLYGRLRSGGDAPPSDGQPVLAQFLEGLAFVTRDRVFASLIGLALFNSVFGLSYIMMLPVFADRYFGAGSTGYGLLSAAHGVGSLIGTFVVASLVHRVRRPGPAMLLGAVCMGCLLMVFARTPSMGFALPVLVLVGFSNTFYLTQVNTYVQQAVPDHLRGRVLGLYSLCWNLVPLGGLLSGVLAAAVNARFAVMVGGAMVAVTALLLVRSPRLQSLRPPGLPA